jgi:hypothetical protein
MTDDDEEFNSLLSEELDLLGFRQRVIFWDTFQEKRCIFTGRKYSIFYGLAYHDREISDSVSSMTTHVYITSTNLFLCASAHTSTVNCCITEWDYH